MRLKRLLGIDKWEVRRTIWPYKDGWGVYNPSRRTIIATGLTKADAIALAAEMNAGK
jgi:hypothetical protein